MTAALLRWWTVPRLNVVIPTHPVLVRAVQQKKLARKIYPRHAIFESNMKVSARIGKR